MVTNVNTTRLIRKEGNFNPFFEVTNCDLKEIPT